VATPKILKKSKKINKCCTNWDFLFNCDLRFRGGEREDDSCHLSAIVVKHCRAMWLYKPLPRAQSAQMLTAIQLTQLPFPFTTQE
jgi:hypothetical protein